jgi:hypothetical protein
MDLMFRIWGYLILLIRLNQSGALRDKVEAGMVIWDAKLQTSHNQDLKPL